MLLISMNLNTIAYDFGSATFNDLGHELLNRNFDDGLSNWSVSGGSATTTTAGYIGKGLHVTSSGREVRISQMFDSNLVARIRGNTLTFSFAFKSSSSGDQARAMVIYRSYEPSSGGGGGGGGGGGTSPLPTPFSSTRNLAFSRTEQIQIFNRESQTTIQSDSLSPLTGIEDDPWEDRSTDTNKPWKIVSGDFSIPESLGGYIVEDIEVIISLRDKNGNSISSYIDSAEISLQLGTFFDGYITYNHIERGKQSARATYGIDINVFSLGDNSGSFGAQKLMVLGISAYAYSNGLGIDMTDLKIQLVPNYNSPSPQKGILQATQVKAVDNRPLSTVPAQDNSEKEVMYRLTKFGLNLAIGKILGPAALPIDIITTATGLNNEVDGFISTVAGKLASRPDPLVFDKNADTYDEKDDTIRFEMSSFNSTPMPLPGDPTNIFYSVADISIVTVFVSWYYDSGNSGYGLDISAEFSWGYWVSNDDSAWYNDNALSTSLSFSLMV